MTEGGAAVSVSNSRVFVGEVEGLTRGGSGDHLVGLFGEVIEAVHEAGGISFAFDAVEGGEEVSAVVEPVEGEAAGWLEVADVDVFGGVAVDAEGVIARAQIGGAPE